MKGQFKQARKVLDFMAKVNGNEKGLPAEIDLSKVTVVSTFHFLSISLAARGNPISISNNISKLCQNHQIMCIGATS